MTSSGDQPRFGERAESHPLGDRVEGRQAPGYGEYAPEGWVNPVAPVDEPSAIPWGDGPQDPRGAGAVRTETRPPQTPGALDAPPPTGAPVPGRPPAAVRNSSFNRFATILLLGYGLYYVIRGALGVSSFVTMYVAQFRGLGYVSGTFESGQALHLVAAISAIVSVALFLLVAIWAIRRLRAGKRSWVILLVSGVVVNLLTGIAVVSVVMNDPSFVARL